MNTQERIDTIIASKKASQVIHGHYIDLVPYVSDHSRYIVKLRNQEKSRYYLNQTTCSAISEQNEWFEGYLKRDNDIYWCIYNKSDDLIGTIRIYDIEGSGSSCMQGSFIIDDEHAMSGPYALEAELLSLDFAFDVLKMRIVLNANRADNTNMNSISRRIGFETKEDFLNNGVKYVLLELRRENYKRSNLKKFLDMWKIRGL